MFIDFSPLTRINVGVDSARSPSESARESRDSRRLSAVDFNEILARSELASSDAAGKAGHGADTLGELVLQWKQEREREIDVHAAAQLVRALAHGHRPKDLLARWQVLVGTGRSNSSLFDREQLKETVTALMTELPQALGASLMPSLMGPFLTQLQSEIGDVVHAMTCKGHTPVLDPSIARAPCFVEVRRRYDELLPSIERAQKELEAARHGLLAVVRDGRGDSADVVDHYLVAAETLAAQLELADEQELNHDLALGQTHLAFKSHIWSASAKAATIAVTLSPAHALWPLGEAAQIVTRTLDRALGDSVVDELNLRHADVLTEDAKDLPATHIEAVHVDPQKLRMLTRGPATRLVDLVCEVLGHRLKEAATPGQAAAAGHALEQLKLHGPAGIRSDDPAAQLFLDRKLLLAEVLKARLTTQEWAQRIGKAYCAKLMRMPGAAIATETLKPMAHGVLAAGSANAANSIAVSSVVTASGTVRGKPPAAPAPAGWIEWGAQNVGYVVSAASALSAGFRHALHGLQAHPRRQASVKAVAGAREALGKGLAGAVATEVLDSIDTDGANHERTRTIAASAAAVIRKLAAPDLAHAKCDSLVWKPVASERDVGELQRSGAQVIVLRSGSHVMCFAANERGQWMCSEGPGRWVQATPGQVMRAMTGQRVDAAAIG